MSAGDFRSWFSVLTEHAQPWPWQLDLAARDTCDDALIRIPTGFGKTEGALSTWLWHRTVCRRSDWPRRLVWCLPMRVLVEQTAATATALAERARALGAEPVSVHLLLGGEEPGDWHLYPERSAILIGTQDMLLSRALNRGYAAGRARWPMDFALLNHDALWVMDEVQLMDVGLTTSVQLQAFRDQESAKGLRPCHTWWMSATLQPDWLTTVDYAARRDELRAASLRIPGAQRTGHLWTAAKPLTFETVPAEEDKKFQRFADLVLTTHDALSRDGARLTLAVLNRVDSAVATHDALVSALKARKDRPDLRLLHSRFRPAERATWLDEFLSRRQSTDASINRIIVATQVVEAGLDISVGALVTELAPWSSLVQRAGRVARYGGSGRIIIVDRQVSGKAVRPYEEAAVTGAGTALAELTDMGLLALECYEESLSTPQVAVLYPYEPAHVLLRHELDDLFDTSPDLAGADIDISRFIRSGEETDLHVWWAAVAEGHPPGAELQPQRHELCPVPVYAARDWLLKASEAPPAWVWDFVDEQWRRVRRQADLLPGQTVLVDAANGGYDLGRGFMGARSRRAVPVVPRPLRHLDTSGDASLQDDSLSEGTEWKTIATHSQEVAVEVARLCEALTVASSDHLGTVLDLAARLHDWGKAHPVFQHNIVRSPGTPDRLDFAKFQRMRHPREATFSDPGVPVGPRRGFRHELASVVGLFEWLALVAPEHPALTGGIADLIEADVVVPEVQPPAMPSGDGVSAALRTLSPDDFDLLVYLVASHHGKVRGTLQSTAFDQAFPLFDTRFAGEGIPIRGVRTGDVLPAIVVVGPHEDEIASPVVICRLDLASIGVSGRYGRPWVERVAGLRHRYGPFTLAYLEALFRAADARASRLTSADPRVHPVRERA